MTGGWLLACLGWLWVGCEAPPTPTPAAGAKGKTPLEVVCVVPEVAQLVEHEEFSGRLVAAEAVDIKARVSGPLEQILFRDGEDVAEGAPLFQLDDRQFVAELERAQASLRMQTTRLDKLRRQERRSARLLETRSISQEDYDDIAFDLAEAEAGLSAAQAAARLAELNLGYTRIASRISGRISRHLVDPGNLVRADETLLARVVDLDPIHAYFDVDERTVLRLQRLVQAGRATSAREQEIPVEVRLADEERATLSARFNFLDNEVDPDTGTLMARAELSNPDRQLTPGLFVRLRVPIGAPQSVLLIPEEALASDQGERFVHLATADNRVEHRRVTVGWREGNRRVIRSGLQPTDRLIVTNLQRLRAGDEVQIKPDPPLGAPGPAAETAAAESPDRESPAPAGSVAPALAPAETLTPTATANRPPNPAAQQSPAPADSPADSPAQPSQVSPRGSSGAGGATTAPPTATVGPAPAKG